MNLWDDTLFYQEKVRPSLKGDVDDDVAIVGGGYTGLWSAYHLLSLDPSLKIVISEAERIGFGASGRNGGWCSALFPVGLEKLAQQSNRETAIKMQNVMFETVEEVGKIIKNEGFEVEWQKGGSFSIARDEIQLKRAEEEFNHFQEWGFSTSDFSFLVISETIFLFSKIS